jgi:hypothetical protein
VGANWGTVDRNTIGSPQVALRAGPVVAPGTGTSAPPFGNGSLGFAVGQNAQDTAPKQEKAAFGNQVDFVGDLVLDVDEVGFRVFQTGENNAKGTPNMPNIAFEIDKNGGTLNAGEFSTAVFNPTSNPTANQWTGYIDATDGAQGEWTLTGSAGTDTGCVLATPCTFDEMQTQLNDAATIATVQVQKGRDFAWQGGIDGLRINNEVFDFEPFGVITRAP